MYSSPALRDGYAKRRCAAFGVGRSKARLMMDALPSIRVGNKDYISQKALNDYLTVNGGIPISWPKRQR